jgi:hypothetical protein
MKRFTVHSTSRQSKKIFNGLANRKENSATAYYMKMTVDDEGVEVSSRVSGNNVRATVKHGVKLREPTAWDSEVDGELR